MLAGQESGAGLVGHSFRGLLGSGVVCLCSRERKEKGVSEMESRGCVVHHVTLSQKVSRMMGAAATANRALILAVKGSLGRCSDHTTIWSCCASVLFRTAPVSAAERTFGSPDRPNWFQ